MFEVKEVKKTSPHIYVLKDANNETIIGSFYEEELQKSIQERDAAYVGCLGLPF